MKISSSSVLRTFLFLTVIFSSFFIGGVKAEAGTTPTIENGGLWFYQQSNITDYTVCQAMVYLTSDVWDLSTCDGNGNCTQITPSSGYVWVDRSYVTGSEQGVFQMQQCRIDSQYTTYVKKATFAASTNKDTYTPGELVTVSAAAASGDQSSTMGGFFSGGIVNSINNSWLNPLCVLFCSSTPAVGVSAYYDGVKVAHCDATGDCDNSPGQKFFAPSVPGTYHISLSGWWYVSDQNIGTSDMTFNVACPSGTIWNSSTTVCDPTSPTVDVHFSFFDKIKSFISDTLINKVFASGK